MNHLFIFIQILYRLGIAASAGSPTIGGGAGSSLVAQISSAWARSFVQSPRHLPGRKTFSVVTSIWTDSAGTFSQILAIFYRHAELTWSPMMGIIGSAMIRSVILYAGSSAQGLVATWHPSRLIFIGLGGRHSFSTAWLILAETLGPRSVGQHAYWHVDEYGTCAGCCFLWMIFSWETLRHPYMFYGAYTIITVASNGSCITP